MVIFLRNGLDRYQIKIPDHTHELQYDQNTRLNWFTQCNSWWCTLQISFVAQLTSELNAQISKNNINIMNCFSDFEKHQPVSKIAQQISEHQNNEHTQTQIYANLNCAAQSNLSLLSRSYVKKRIMPRSVTNTTRNPPITYMMPFGPSSLSCKRKWIFSLCYRAKLYDNVFWWICHAYGEGNSMGHGNHLFHEYRFPKWIIYNGLQLQWFDLEINC